MNARAKRVPRLWCARLGLLPFEVVLPHHAPADRRPRNQVRASFPTVSPGTDQRERGAAHVPPDRMLPDSGGARSGGHLFPACGRSGSDGYRYFLDGVVL
jgi:hypothetical protein